MFMEGAKNTSYPDCFIANRYRMIFIPIVTGFSIEIVVLMPSSSSSPDVVEDPGFAPKKRALCMV